MLWNENCLFLLITVSSFSCPISRKHEKTLTCSWGKTWTLRCPTTSKCISSRSSPNELNTLQVHLPESSGFKRFINNISCDGSSLDEACTGCKKPFTSLNHLFKIPTWKHSLWSKFSARYPFTKLLCQRIYFRSRPFVCYSLKEKNH